MTKLRKNELRERSIEATVKQHRGRVTSVIRTMLRDQAEIDDVLQEVFEEYVEAYDVDQVIETVGAWLARVARNKVLDRFRRNKTQNDYQLIVRGEAEKEDDRSPETEWQRERFREAIVRALADLPSEQRDVFVRHELEGQSFEEISRETGVPKNTLLSRKRYAVVALRKYLKEVYDELGDEGTE